MTKAGSRILEGAREALAIARGEADPSTYTVHAPETIDVRAIRKQLNLNQEQFAERYRIGVARLRDWEQGRSAPDSVARSYLQVIRSDPDAVHRALSK